MISLCNGWEFDYNWSEGFARFETEAETLYQAILSDKKRRGSRISLIVPVEIGHCEIRRMTLEEMKHFLKAGF